MHRQLLHICDARLRLGRSFRQGPTGSPSEPQAEVPMTTACGQSQSSSWVPEAFVTAVP